jgi:ubiquinone/menaquinone biosynthesis C-methylase UbiE
MDDNFARSFGGVADAYERGRPGYPTEAVQWLVGTEPRTVLELGAGTGKLTETLVELGHDVHACEPDEEMLAILRRKLPDIRSSASVAEQIPAPDHSFDVVVAAQSLHWFDLDLALPEINRVLKPGGRIAVVWNVRDESMPWVRKLGRIIGTQEQLREPEQPLVKSGLFGFVEQTSYKFWQQIDRRSIVDLVTSRSNIAVLDEAAREAKLRELLAFYDDYGRGMDGMRLPYDCDCYRATVIKKTASSPPPEFEPEEPRPLFVDEVRRPEAPSGTSEGDSKDEKPKVDGDDDDLLLIHFR